MSTPVAGQGNAAQPPVGTNSIQVAGYKNVRVDRGTAGTIITIQTKFKGKNCTLTVRFEEQKSDEQIKAYLKQPEVEKFHTSLLNQLTIFNKHFKPHFRNRTDLRMTASNGQIFFEYKQPGKGEPKDKKIEVTGDKWKEEFKKGVEKYTKKALKAAEKGKGIKRMGSEHRAKMFERLSEKFEKLMKESSQPSSRRSVEVRESITLAREGELD